ncbi:MAG TPA: 50S ribosomal protein L22 [Clostridiales bacterium]|nr:50S ribosomal protein L22 [Clostridiales bacterium]
MATRIREKARAREENRDNRPSAKLNYLRMSPSKVRLVLDEIRGKKVDDAIAILSLSEKVAAEPILKLLNSAIANAENNLGMNRDELYVAETYANEGPTLKRIRPRARGRATRIRKRTSHVTIILDQIER